MKTSDNMNTKTLNKVAVHIKTQNHVRGYVYTSEIRFRLIFNIN